MPWSIDFIAALPLCSENNAIFTFLDRFNKFYRLMPCFVELFMEL